MAVEIGALRALLSLDSAAFESGAKRAQAAMGRLQRNLTKSADSMKKIGRRMSLGITAPIVGATGLMVRSSLSTIDAQGKMAQSLGTTTESLQILARAADTAGVSQSDLEGALTRMTRRISLAEQGTGPAVKALERLNIAAEDVADLTADERIKLIQERIQEFIPAAEQAGVSSQIFGDRVGIAMTRLDASQIEQAESALKRFGVTVTEVDTDKIEEANDALTAIGLVSQGLANQLTVALAPALKSIAERIADVGEWFSNLSPEMKRFAGLGVAVAAALGPVLVGLGFMAAGLAALASPIGLVVLGLGAVIGVAAAVAANWDSLIAKFPALGEAAERVGNALSAAWEGIKGQVVALKDIVNGALNAIIGILTGDLERAWEGFKTSLGGVKDFAQETIDAMIGIFDALLPGVRDAIAGIPEAVKQTFNDLMAWLRGVPERMVQIGSDIIQGLIDGITGQLPTVGSSSRKAAREAIDAVKDETETRSPSRVFMDIGRDLMAGLGIGVQEGAAAVNGTMQQAAQQITSQVEGIGNTFDMTGDRFGSMVADIVTGSRKAGDVLKQLGNSLISSGISGIASSIFGGSGLGKVFAGLFDSGGMIPAGQFGIAGERGPEIVTGPARVTSRANTARMMGGGQVGGTATIRLIAPEGFTVAQENRVQGIAVQVVSDGLSAYDRETLPGSVERVQNDPRLRG